MRRPRDNLLQHWVYFVEVCGFLFQFQSLNQMEECLRHFSRKVHGTSREPGITLEHYWQRWFERLPRRLNRGSNRLRVARAMEQALIRFRNEVRSNPALQRTGRKRPSAELVR